MSRRKDRARAQSGTIFRDGKLVNAEEWYVAHPTRETLAKRQAEVDEAIAEMKRHETTPEEHKAAGAPPFDYFCTKCEHTHKHGSKIHENHAMLAKVEPDEGA